MNLSGETNYEFKDFLINSFVLKKHKKLKEIGL
jgi:hypothetical protein